MPKAESLKLELSEGPSPRGQPQLSSAAEAINSDFISHRVAVEAGQNCTTSTLCNSPQLKSTQIHSNAEKGWQEVVISILMGFPNTCNQWVLKFIAWRLILQVTLLPPQLATDENFLPLQGPPLRKRELSLEDPKRRDRIDFLD
jgi:hypothetical protein